MSVKAFTRVSALATVVLLYVVTTPAQQHWTGDGGRGKSIAITPPQGIGLLDGFEYLPDLVQGELVSNFSGFSAISVFNRQDMEKVFLELMEGIYDENSEALSNFGRQVPTDYMLVGKITRTQSGYALQLSINRTSDQTTVASYSGTCTFNELDNLTGVRRASAELLEKMGVTLTQQAKTALAGAATSNHVSAQTALAHGIVAQRQGTEVAALSYFYQAAAFDPSLAEAVKRSSVMSANISSANIGENIRNDIVWRRDWVARLNQIENAFHQMIGNADAPYKLYYSTDIETKNINYQTETADISIATNLYSDAGWFLALQRALQAAKAVMDGLDATNRKNDWQLRYWPQQGVSNNNPFGRYWQYDIDVEFELLDQHGRVIGRQNARLRPSFHITKDNNNRFIVNHTENTPGSVIFKGVRADDISDNLTIRPAYVNRMPLETARFTVAPITDYQRRNVERTIEQRRLQDTFLRIENGVVMGFSPSAQRARHNETMSIVIPSEVLGEPVIAIGARAFENSRLRSVTIPNSVRTIGARAFYNNPNLREVVIGPDVTIAQDAFLYEFRHKDGRISIKNNGFIGTYRKYGAGKYTKTAGALSSDIWGLAETENTRKKNTNITIGVIAALIGLLAFGLPAVKGD